MGDEVAEAELDGDVVAVGNGVIGLGVVGDDAVCVARNSGRATAGEGIAGGDRGRIF